ncbi:MAG: hypothetical protein V1897_15890, partial [Pseudomonadota bacterium]
EWLILKNNGYPRSQPRETEWLQLFEFFGLLYPNQVIEDAHKVLVKRPGTSGKRANWKLGELVRCHWSVRTIPDISGLGIHFQTFLGLSLAAHTV